MAIQQNFIVSVFGREVVFEKAYHKILQLSGNKYFFEMEVVVYDEKGGNVLNSTKYSYPVSVADKSENFIKQGYLYLKALPEYKDALDILEEGQ